MEKGFLSRHLKKAVWPMIGLSVIGAVAAYEVGSCPTEDAKKHLEKQGYKVVSDDGPAVLHRKHGYGSRDFTVVDPSGRKERRVVHHNFDDTYEDLPAPEIRFHHYEEPALGAK